MAYLSGYDYDIFLSFSPFDNRPITDQPDGWIEYFYKTLSLTLAKHIGCFDIAKIRKDIVKFDDSAVIDKTVESNIQKSAIMICVYSANYAVSANCKQELDTFYKKANAGKTGLRVGNRSRIIHVLLNNIPADKWPPELSGASRLHFHKAKEASQSGDTLDPFSEEFKNQMQKLGDIVWNLLSDFQNEQAESTLHPGKEPDENKKPFNIYIGEVSDTLRIPRKRIITELKTKGYNVLTGVPPPDESAEHEQATNEALKNADMSVHLLDEFPGREITGDSDKWYPQKQTELALKSGKPQMIWTPEEIDFANIEEENYKQFLYSLEKGKASGKDYEFVRGAKCKLTQDIIDFAEHVRSKQVHRSDRDNVVSVMLDTHYSDQLHAIDLGKILLENQIQPFINPQEDDPRKNINLMGKRLSQVEKLIFLYGNVSEEWLRERMSAAIELIITNNYPIKDFFVYITPPSKNSANIFINQRFLKVNVIDNSKNEIMKKDDLQIFLNALKTSER